MHTENREQRRAAEQRARERAARIREARAVVLARREWCGGGA